MLRQRAEGPEPRAQGQHHVGLGDDLHGRLGALVAERAAPQRMIGGEAVVVQVAVDDGRLQELRQLLRLLEAARHDDATAGDDHRELGLGQQVGRLVQALLGARTARHPLRLRDLAGDLAVEVVTRDIELRRATLGHGHVEAAPRHLGHARRIVHVALEPGDLGEDRQLVRLLEAAEPHAH